MEHAGRAVIFSGIAVAIGLLAMVVLPVPFLRSIGYGGLLIPLISVLVAITLLPVILATVGPRLDRIGLRRRTSSAGQGWVPWGRFVVRRRWVVGGVALAILAVFFIPVLNFSTGTARADALSSSGSARDGARPAHRLRHRRRRPPALRCSRGRAATPTPPSGRSPTSRASAGPSRRPTTSGGAATRRS